MVTLEGWIIITQLIRLVRLGMPLCKISHSGSNLENVEALKKTVHESMFAYVFLYISFCVISDFFFI